MKEALRSSLRKKQGDYGFLKVGHYQEKVGKEGRGGQLLSATGNGGLLRRKLTKEKKCLGENHRTNPLGFAKIGKK